MLEESSNENVAKGAGRGRSRELGAPSHFSKGTLVRKKMLQVVRSEKILAAIALMTPLSLISCFYTLATDAWYAVEFSTTMFVTRGIFRICTTSYGGTECHGNEVTSDFTFGDCVVTARDARNRLNGSLAMHVMGGLFTTFAWMLTAHGYRSASRDTATFDATAVIAAVNNGGALLCFVISTSIMTSTFYFGWYTCGRPYCEYIVPRRYCNEYMGTSLIAAYFSIFLALTCFVLASIRSFRLYRRVKAKAAATAAAAASADAMVGGDRLPPHRRANVPGSSSALRLKHYLDIYAPGSTQEEINALLAQYRDEPEALWDDLVREHGPELSSAERKDIINERREVRKFCVEFGLDKSNVEIAQLVLAAFREHGGDGCGSFESMWKALEHEAGLSSPETLARAARPPSSHGERRVLGPKMAKANGSIQQRQSPLARERAEGKHGITHEQTQPRHQRRWQEEQEVEEEAAIDLSGGVDTATSTSRMDGLIPANELAEPATAIDLGSVSGGEEDQQLGPDHEQEAGDWCTSDDGPFLWSDTLCMYFDVNSGHYFDPYSRQQWYDPFSCVWYTEE